MQITIVINVAMKTFEKLTIFMKFLSTNNSNMINIMREGFFFLLILRLEILIVSLVLSYIGMAILFFNFCVQSMLTKHKLPEWRA
jgi:hypothetical protein